jgi:ATP/maltotriose-dependent transcriptional regulator MalT
LQILSQVGEGLTDAEIAEKIFLSVNTIKWHLRNIYSKLTVRSRLEAVAAAKNKGLIV